MKDAEPVRTDLDPRYSNQEAEATAWPVAVARLREAEIFWLATVRPDSRPHVTPLLGVWHDGALHFTTGPEERKSRNLTSNQHVVLTTGTNTLRAGYDLVVEGDAVLVTDEARLRELAKAWEHKYGPDWAFEVADGAFTHAGGGSTSLVFAVAPRQVFGFGKGEPYSQTRWQFG